MPRDESPARPKPPTFDPHLPLVELGASNGIGDGEPPVERAPPAREPAADMPQPVVGWAETCRLLRRDLEAYEI